MAMGGLLGEFVDREAGAVTPSLRQDLQVPLSEWRACWNVYGSASPNGGGAHRLDPFFSDPILEV